ncbi:hypothetical protein, partial [Parachitinimonas caeni]
RQGPLAVGQGSDCEATVRIPPRLAGRWRIAVQTDVNRSLNEPDRRANNQRLSGPIQIQPSYADLVPTAPVAVGPAYANRPLTVR